MPQCLLPSADRVAPAPSAAPPRGSAQARAPDQPGARQGRSQARRKRGEPGGGHDHARAPPNGRNEMFVVPGTLGYRLTRDAAKQIARNWWLLLLNGLLLIVAGVLIFSIDWSIRSLATFIGVLFIVEGAATADRKSVV